MATKKKEKSKKSPEQNQKKSPKKVTVLKAKTDEQKAKEFFEKNKDAVGRKIGYFVATIINIVALVVAFKLVEWNLKFITDDISAILGLVKFSIIMNIIANAVFIIYDGKIFKSLIQIFLNGVALILLWKMISVYPFNLREVVDIEWINMAFKIGLGVGVFGVVVGSIAELARIVKELGRCRID